MAIFGAASRGAVVALRCPHCGVLQARARTTQGIHASYQCRECTKTFTREAGAARAREESARDVAHRDKPKK